MTEEIDIPSCFFWKSSVAIVVNFQDQDIGKRTIFNARNLMANFLKIIPRKEGCRNEIESLEHCVNQLSFVFNWMPLYTLYHEDIDMTQQSWTWRDCKLLVFIVFEEDHTRCISVQIKIFPIVDKDKDTDK